MARSSGLNLPDIGDLLPYAIILGGGLVLLKPGADGTSLIQRIGVGLNLANMFGGGPGAAPGLPGTPAPPGVNPGGGDNQWGPANGGNDTFNVNTGQSWVHLDTFVGVNNPFNPTISAHVGVGHLGIGGTFSCVIWGQQLGIQGIGGGGATWVGQQNFDAGNDGQWTGYGIDFNNVNITPLGGAGLVNFWTTLYSMDGNSVYTTARLRLA